MTTKETSLKDAISKFTEAQFDISKLSLEERKMILELMPSIFNASTEMMKLTGESRKQMFGLIDTALKVFGDQLKDENLSKEERADINKDIKDLIDKMHKIHKEDKEWSAGIFKTAIGVLGATIAVLGGIYLINDSGSRKKVFDEALKHLTDSSDKK